jgi:hypothetical protein
VWARGPGATPPPPPRIPWVSIPGHGPEDRAAERRGGVGGGVDLGVYPIVTSLYSSATVLYTRLLFYIQSPFFFFESDNRIYPYVDRAVALHERVGSLDVVAEEDVDVEALNNTTYL